MCPHGIELGESVARPPVVGRSEWDAARTELFEREREAARRR
jgi:hypothetical protein